MRSNVFNRLSFISLALVVVLLPLFFLPFSNISTEASKGLLLVAGLFFSFIFWSFARFFDGKIILPKSVCLLSGLGVVLAFLLSALFSKNPHMSLFGTMLDTGSFYFILCGFVLMLMSSIVFRKPQNSKMILFGSILSATVVLLFQTARLFFPEALSFGILAGETSNILGSWNAFGLFAGFSALMSLFVVEFFSTTKVEKSILQALIVFSLIFVAVVNFQLVWGLIGISSLIVFVYKISIVSNGAESAGRKTRFPTVSLIMALVSIFFFVSGAIGDILPNRLGLLNSEVGPSLKATTFITESVLKEDSILGIGPNRFGIAWSMYKPLVINKTQFWDVPFDSGSGLLPTIVSTSGLLSIVAWLVFFVLFILSGVKLIFHNPSSNENWERVAFFVLALYLFIASFFYSVGAVIFLLALAFAGIFIGLSASSHNPKGEISFSLSNSHSKKFISLFFLVLIIIILAGTSFKYTERFLSVFYFGKTLKALQAENIPVAEVSINKALKLYSNDLYLRTYADTYKLKLNSLLQGEVSVAEDDKALLQDTLVQAVKGAQLATTYDGENYLNFQTLGSVYQTAASFGVRDSYELAIAAYGVASTQNPKNPRIKLAMALTANTVRKLEEAKIYAKEALLLKEDYINALVLLSEIAKKEGDKKAALSYAQTALSFAPQDENLITYVDSFYSSPSGDSSSNNGTRGED